MNNNDFLDEDDLYAASIYQEMKAVYLERKQRALLGDDIVNWLSHQNNDVKQEVIKNIRQIMVTHPATIE